MTEEAFEHWCETCGRTEILTSDEAYRQGWDFPPRMGEWGVVSPRTCPSCPMKSTVGWALAMDKLAPETLDARQRAVVTRILAERG